MSPWAGVPLSAALPVTWVPIRTVAVDADGLFGAKGGTHDGPHLHGYRVPSGVALVLLGSLPAPWQVLQPFGLGWALAMRSYPAGFLSP